MVLIGIDPYPFNSMSFWETIDIDIQYVVVS